MNPQTSHRPPRLLCFLILLSGTCAAGCSGNSDSKAFLDAVSKVQAGQSDAVDVRDFPNLTDKDLAALGQLDGLRQLNLDFAPITDSGLEHVAGLRTLQSLSLSKTRITDVGMVQLRELTALEFLRLDEDHLTDGGLASLAGLTRLKELSLWRVFLTDKGLVHLKGLTALERLSLDETQVTAEGVKSLVASLPRLKHLRVWKTRVGPGALADLKWSRPNLKIEQ
jgi:hypothetical protein